MGGRASKEGPASSPPPSAEQLSKAEGVIKAKGGKQLDRDPEWTISTNRSCTDCLFWVLFLLFQAGVIVVAGFGFAYGDPERLVYGYDFLGQTCGRAGTANANRTYL